MENGKPTPREHTLQVLFRAERQGFGSKPGYEVRLTLESFEGKRYAAWGAYSTPQSTRAEKLISIRQDELQGLLSALQRAQELWAKDDAEFSGERSHREYAASLDWG